MDERRNPRPLISVGLPVYNGERFLAEAVDGVLAQTDGDFELIVVDNASTDRTAEICRDYAARDPRIRYYRNEVNLGAARNFNRAFELAVGEYFRWVAVDDLFDPGFHAHCRAALEREPTAVLAYPLARCIDEHGRNLHRYEQALQHVEWSASPTERFRQLAEEFFASGGVSAPVYLFGLMRADLLRRTRLHGTYIASDWILLAELALLGRFFELPEYLTSIRAHPDSSSLGRHRGQWDKVATFFDPAARGRFDVMLSSGRRFAEYFVAIGRSPLPRAAKASLLAYNTAVTARRAARRIGWYLTGTAPWQRHENPGT